MNDKKHLIVLLNIHAYVYVRTKEQIHGFSLEVDQQLVGVYNSVVE